jgi:hypothetical protein
VNPNPVRIALSEKLKGDATLESLAIGGIHHKIAPQGVKPPFLIFSKSSGIPTWAFDGPPMDREVWLVKGVGVRQVAEELDRRCKELLNGTTLDIDGKVHQDIRHIGDVDYDEIVEGERYNHVGAEYRISSEDDN